MAIKCNLKEIRNKRNLQQKEPVLHSNPTAEPSADIKPENDVPVWKWLSGWLPI